MDPGLEELLDFSSELEAAAMLLIVRGHFHKLPSKINRARTVIAVSVRPLFYRSQSAPFSHQPVLGIAQCAQQHSRDEGRYGMWKSLSAHGKFRSRLHALMQKRSNSRRLRIWSGSLGVNNFLSQFLIAPR